MSRVYNVTVNPASLIERPSQTLLNPSIAFKVDSHFGALRMDEWSGREQVGLSEDVLRLDARTLSIQMANLRSKLFPPLAQKELRSFSAGEAAQLLGISDSYLRQLALAGETRDLPAAKGGRRIFSLKQVHHLREVIARKGRQRLPGRIDGDHLQILAVANFKGGSGKTTTAAHLAQFLAIHGYRTLAIDLDPQASLSSLMGYQPEFDVGDNETLYGAIRYDDHQRTIRDVIKATYIPGLSLIPANLELQEFEHDTPRQLADRKIGRREALFFDRLRQAISTVERDFDCVVLDCPPQLGFLTLSALCAATALLITIHPQMLDVASMGQFLLMTSDLLAVVTNAGGTLSYDFMRYLVTRYEPQDAPQTQVVGLLRSLFGERVLTNPMIKSTAISDAGLSKQTFYEVNPRSFSPGTYTRAAEALGAVNGEVGALIQKAWGRVA